MGSLVELSQLEIVEGACSIPGIFIMFTLGLSSMESLHHKMKMQAV